VRFSQQRLALFLLMASLFLSVPGPLLAATSETTRNQPPFPARCELYERDRDLAMLQDMQINIDGVFEGWARVYLIEEELQKLRTLGFEVTVLPDRAPEMARRLREEPPTPRGTRAVPATYHTYATLTAELQQIAIDHPTIAELISIGQTEQGRNMWMMKLSDNLGIDEDEPEFAYISSMHGDEVVGKELCVNLINYLTDNYGSDTRVTNLIDDTEIWIMPSMNPDGTELGRRGNANNVDLNRDFPDQFIDPINTGAGRAAETQAVMQWAEAHNMVLTANFHGGALVANYPFDSNPAGSSTFSPAPAPDHAAFMSLARTYADNNPPMSASFSFPNGITNGADWYSINGGMQDWEYVWHGDFDITVEVSNTKWPAASQLPDFWDDNLESMLAYIERVHTGIRGLVTDADDGSALLATIKVDSNQFDSHTDRAIGDYHRIILAGSYSFEFSAVGYITQTFDNVVIGGGAATLLDVALERQPVDLQPVSNKVEDGPSGNGWLDAGESTDLSVTLENMGSDASAVTGKLIPTGWLATASRPDAGYPDIKLSQTGGSLLPHYEVTVQPTIPAGRRVGFAVQWSADEGSGISDPFFLAIGEPSCTTYSATDLPQTISKIFSTSSDIVLPAGGEISFVNIMVDISHTYIGDLEVVLTSASGSSVLLHDRTGASADNIIGTYGIDLVPAEDLAALIGEGPGGTWTLNIEDFIFANSGTLNAWSVEICNSPAETTTPEMRFKELSTGNDGVLLEWWPYPGLSDYRVYSSADASSPAAFLDVTSGDDDSSDTRFIDTSTAPLLFYLVTGVGPGGEGP
jgi:subtilisin-like proprotein convertase family protein